MRSGVPSVLVVADGGTRAATLEAALRDETGLRVVVGRPGALGQLVEEHVPDVVILASTAARIAAALATMSDLVRTPAVIVLVDDPRAVWTALARRAGVRAALRADAPPGQIAAAIHGAMTGLIVLDPGVVRPARPVAAGETGEDRALTAREREVLGMVAEGLSNRAIARRLGISTFTVKFHVASILGKLGAGTRTEAVTLGVRGGLISL